MRERILAGRRGMKRRAAFPAPRLPAPVGIPLSRGMIADRASPSARDLNTKGSARSVPAPCYPFPGGGLDQLGLILIRYDLLPELKLLLPISGLVCPQLPVLCGAGSGI